MTRASRRICTLFVLFIGALAACRRKSTQPTLPEWQPEIARTPERWLQEPSVRLLRDYVRIDTTDPPGRERPGAEFLKEYLDCEGIASQLVCAEEQRCNLYARLPGKDRSRALLLLNHIDVVPAYRPDWKYPVFEGTIDKSYLYGRGVYDMKSIGIAQLLAFVELAHSGIQPARDVIFLAECGEEYRGTDGVSWIYEHRPELLAGVDCVLNEGGYEETIAGVLRNWQIEIGQGGSATVIFGSDDSEALKFGPENETLGLFVSPEPAVKRYFTEIAEFRQPFLLRAYRNPESIRNPEIKHWIPYQQLSLIAGGVLRSQPFSAKYFPGYPDRGKWVSVVIVSLPLGIDPRSELERLLEAGRAKGAGVVFSLLTPPGSASPYPSPETRAIERALAATHPGIPVLPLINAFSETTSTEFRRRGIAAYGFTPFEIDPSDAARRHGNDERVFLPFYVRGVETMRETLFEMVASVEKN